MKVKDIIKVSMDNWRIAGDNYPAFKAQGQTEFTWENYHKLKQLAEDFDNQDAISGADVE